MSAVLKNIAKDIIIDGKQARRFFSTFFPKIVKAGEVILYPGDICTHEVFIVSGELHLYEINQKNEVEEIVSAGTNEWFNERHSFITEEPTPYYFAAKTDAELLIMDKKDFRWLYRQVPLFQEFFRNQLEKSYVRLEMARRKLNARHREK